MRCRAFTLIEVMAVVVLMGLLAAATVWSIAGAARRYSRADVAGLIAHADRTARLTAQRLGRAWTLSINLDAQRMWTSPKESGQRDERSHELQLPASFRIARLFVASQGDQRTGSDNGAGWMSAGVAQIACSSAGRSVSYVVELQARDAQERSWLVFAGLTGQMTVIDDEDEMDNLLAMLAADRHDAD